eukprot:10559559-Ditylum_brightwellii.AAC.1
MGLTQSVNAPYLFMGSNISNSPPIYTGLYEDDFLYFSESTEVEQTFEKHFKEEQNMIVDFDRDLVFFLGMCIDEIEDNDELSIFLPQEATINTLLEEVNLTTANFVPTPYQAGYPVDKISNTTQHPLKALDPLLDH